MPKLTTSTTICLLIVCTLLATSVSHAAVIVEFKSLKIDFTNPKDASAKASWSPANKLSITDEGLGWDGPANASVDGWIQTKPLAVGLSWRTATSISLQITIDPEPKEFILPNGQKSTPYTGRVFARYSPDMKHWSTWQELQSTDLGQNLPKKSGRHFSGRLTVPNRARHPYGLLLSEYSKQDVPWKSDEEAAVDWILKQQPDFFSKHLPFIGYVEFLFEGGMYGNQRIRSFNADLSYALSGLHAIPRDKEVYKNRDSIPWRFKAAGIKNIEILPNQK